MGATYARRGKRSFLVTVWRDGQRERRTIHGTEQDAKDLVRYIHRQELAGINVVESLRQARTFEPVTEATVQHPPLRNALPDWLDRQRLAGEIRESTARMYRDRLRVWCYPHPLPDGRQLGDVTVDVVTREMLGSMIRRIRESGRSMAIVEGCRNPLRSFYQDLIERKEHPGPNPAGDLKHFVGKGAHRKARSRPLAYFSQEEGPQLIATAKALCPRWAPFIMTSLLAGLRWGEAAALLRSDID
jgi:hypothetical protein